MNLVRYSWPGALLGIIVFSVFSGAPPCYAQSASTATIVGTILDPQGAPVPSAVVRARNRDTGVERTVTTTSEGLYRIPNVPPGFYSIRVEASGFATTIANDVLVEVGDEKNVSLSVRLGTVDQKVEVSSAIPLIETTKTDTSTVIDEKEMAALPVLNSGLGPFDDYANLAASAPAIRFDLSGNSFDLIGPGSINYHANTYNVDGGNISDSISAGRDAVGASLDEVKEFQVISSNYNAEYGEAGALIVNVVTKSGTNDFHGTAHAAFRGRNLAASNFFYNAFNPMAEFGRAPFHKQEGGFTAGGPFIKNRTFWFMSLDKVAQGVPLTLVNQPPDYVHSVTVSQPLNETNWSVKLDHEITKNHHLMVRFNADRQFNDNFVNQVPQFAQPSSLSVNAFHDHTFNVGLTSILGPHLVNEGRFFWHRYLISIPDKTNEPGEEGPNFYAGAASAGPAAALAQRYQYTDNLTWIRERHTFKWGTNINHLPNTVTFPQFHNGLWQGFSAANVASPPGSPTNLPTGLTVAIGPGKVHPTDTVYGFYGQDSWVIRPNLTLNYGLRYDVEKGAFKGGSIPNPAGGCFQGNGILPACSSDNNNFQPRLGVAWGPRFASGLGRWMFGDVGKTVVRASVSEITEMAYLNLADDSLTFDGVTLLTQTISLSPCPPTVTPCGNSLLQYFPNLPPATALAAFRPAGTDFFGRVRVNSSNLRNPETRHLSLNISRQIKNDFVLDVGYIGVLGYGEFGENDLNYPVITPDPAHPGYSYFGVQPNTAPGTTPAARLDSRFAAIRTHQNTRTSAYHGLVASLTKRFAQHYQFSANYTFSKTLSSAEDFYGTSEPGDPRNIGAERSVTQNNVPHLVNFSFVYDSARLSSRAGISQLVNNWTIGIIGTLQSGRPYPVSTGDVPFQGTNYGGIGAETQQRPNVLANGILSATNIAGSSGLNLAVSQSGAAQCNCPQTTFLAPANADPNGPVDSFTGVPVDFQYLNGNLSRNAGIGSPYRRADLSLKKAFGIVPRHESLRLEFRVDAINVFNHANFTLYNGSDVLSLFHLSTDPNCRSCLNAFSGFYIGSTGQPLTIQDLRHGRVSGDLGNPRFAGLGDPTAADIPRTLQLSLHFTW